MIFHYTSLEVLALILKNRSIRFTRLSNLDDPLEKYVKVKTFTPEHRFIDSREELGEFCYVSCWSAESDESIPMWDMYGDRKRGVRIGLPEDMFKPDKVYRNGKLTKGALFDVEERSIVPELIKIDYNRVDDPKIITDDWKIDIGELGKYKIKEWAFQKECRFRIYASRESKDDDTKFFYRADKWIESCEVDLKWPLSQENIDWPLNEETLREIDVLIGPNMTDGAKELLSALIGEYHIDEKQVGVSKFRV